MGASHKYVPGDTIELSRYPGISFVVLKTMISPERKENVYSVRFADKPEDTRGFLVWEETIRKAP
jgi:hypothetical protein